MAPGTEGTFFHQRCSRGNRLEKLTSGAVWFCLLTLFTFGCGTNEVTVQIRGGDGVPIRLDANSLKHGRNQLVEGSSFSFSDVKGGSCQVNVVAGSYLGTHTFEIGSPPIVGNTSFDKIFDIPSGSNGSFAREGTILFSSTRTTSRNWDLFTIKAMGASLPNSLPPRSRNKAEPGLPTVIGSPSPRAMSSRTSMSTPCRLMGRNGGA